MARAGEKPSFITKSGTYKLYGELRVVVTPGEGGASYSPTRPSAVGEVALLQRRDELRNWADWFIHAESADRVQIFNGAELVRVQFGGAVADVASSVETPAVVGSAPAEVIDRLPREFLHNFGGR